MANPWFRMYAEFATDPKVQRLSEVEQRRYLMVLCLRCSNGNVTLHDDDIVFQLRISHDEWQETKAILHGKKLLDKDNKPTAWEKRQFASDTSAARVARHRELKKSKCNADVTLQKRKSNALDTDTDTDTDKKPYVVSDAGRPACPHEQIVSLYHEVLPTLPAVKVWNDKRKNALKARWLEDEARQSLDFWRRFFEYVSQSDFLCGRSGTFQASLEWLINSSNFIKVIEGNYENRKAA